MDGLCPCCGHPVDDLVPAGLTQRETTIYSAVKRSMPNGISREQLVDRVYANDPQGGPEWGTNCVTVAVTNLNRKLRARGLKITALGIGRVYRLVETPAYDGQDDFAKSLTAGYDAIRERMANGGPGWNPKRL